MTASFQPCPCCEQATLSARDAFEICRICGWEDDPAQSRDEALTGGANDLSLAMAREQWKILTDRRG